MNMPFKPKLLIVEDDEGLQRQLRWAYDDYEVLIASNASAAVDLLRAERREADIAIEIADRGSGMSADFVRTRLFQPFASTKKDGFGVGAFEARTLVAAMGGRLDVASREGEGSRFTVFLPLGETQASPGQQRMEA